MSSGQQVVVSFEIDLNVQPAKYTFSLGTGEPSGDQEPNIGYIHDRYELLGPITVIADLTKTLPFYGCARLPMRITHWHLSKDRGFEDVNCVTKKL